MSTPERVITIRPRLLLRRNEYGAYILTQLSMFEGLPPHEVVIQVSELLDVIRAFQEMERDS